MLRPNQATYLCVFANILFTGMVAHGQSNRPGLITQPVNERDRVELAGGADALTARTGVRVENRGPVPASMPVERMLLMLRRSADRELALERLIQSLHDSNSPSYHRWLTPEQFGQEWGAADGDIAIVQGWLRSHGFEVKGATAGRTAIEFSGTAGEIEEAFHTSIHSFVVGGALHHANVSNPQIPSALAGVVAGIRTLNDFHPHSMVKKGARGVYDVSTKRIRPDTNGPQMIRPELTATGVNGSYLYVGPADAATIYDIPNKALNSAATGVTFDGTGAKIGIIGDSDFSLAENAQYRRLFGLAANAPTVIRDGSVDPELNGDVVEAYLDTQVANGIAPGAKIYFYTAADTAMRSGLELAATRAVNDNVVDVISVSFGECEDDLGDTGNQFWAGLWEQAAAQGMSVTVSTGDSGSAGCDDPEGETVAQRGLKVNGLASTPYNIAVGGTDFAALAGPDGSGLDFEAYVSTDSDTGSLRSALWYIPEVPWNDSLLNYPPQQIAQTEAEPGQFASIVAGGGGRSSCAEGLSKGTLFQCLAGYQKPSWQSARGVPNDHVRDLPDVSMFAANGLYRASWGICTDQDADDEGNPVEDCTPGSNGLPAEDFYIYGVGGTSASAPAFAGILALIRQAAGERQGQANYALYNLARTVPAVFHDVTSGNNSVPCQSSSTNCGINSAGANYLTGYNAVAGYDMASGLGSVDASALIAHWASAGLSATTTNLILTPAVIQHGQFVTANATVSASRGIAAGEVALSAAADGPGLRVGSSVGYYSLNSRGSTGKLSINDLPGGSYKVVASYGGAQGLAGSLSAPVDVTVTPEPSTTEVTISAYNPQTNEISSSTPYGYQLDFTAQPYGSRSPRAGGVVVPDGVATGAVTFVVGSSSLGTPALSPAGIASFHSPFLKAGSYTVSANYHGDNSFDPSTGSKVLDISKAATAITLASSLNSSALGEAMTFTVRLASNSAGIAPTGKVVLEDGGKILAEANLAGTGATDYSFAQGTATIIVDNLPVGKDQIKAVYQGDRNYAESISDVRMIDNSRAATRLALTIGPASLAGKPQLFKAKLTTASNGAAPTGMVAIEIGTTVLGQGRIVGVSGSSSVAASGSVAIVVRKMPVGVDGIKAVYLGDSQYGASTSNAVTADVLKASASVTLTGASRTYAGGPSIFMVEVTGPIKGVAPTGVIALESGARILARENLSGVAGSAVTAAWGRVAINATGLAVGTDEISAVYFGDGDYNGAKSRVATVLVIKAPTQLKLTSSASASEGVPVTFTVRLNSPGNGIAPTGLVKLQAGAKLVAQGKLLGVAGSGADKASGEVTFSTVDLPEGADTVTAVYEGDGNYDSSISNTADVSIESSLQLSRVETGSLNCGILSASRAGAIQELR